MATCNDEKKSKRSIEDTLKKAASTAGNKFECDTLKEAKRKMEEAIPKSTRKSYAKVNKHVFEGGLSHESSGSDIDRGEEEHVDAPVESRLTYSQWIMEKKAGNKPNEFVFNFPHKVIRNKTHRINRRMRVVDSCTGNSYMCELHKVEKKHFVEELKGDGWDSFVRDKQLKRGDRIAFQLGDPPGEEMIVTVLKN